MNNRQAETGIEQRPDVDLQSVGDRLLLCFGSGAKCRAGKRQALEHDRHDVQVHLAAFEEGDLHKPAFHGQRIDISLQVATPDHIEDQVDPLACGFGVDHLDEVFFVVVDDPAGACATTGL